MKLTIKQIRTAINQLRGPATKPKPGQRIVWYDGIWHIVDIPKEKLDNLR